jgi:hypothetical protein
MLTCPVHSSLDRGNVTMSGSMFFRHGRMHSKQHNAGTFESDPSLHRELPEVLIECHEQSAVCFGPLYQNSILQARTVRPDPDNIMTFFGDLDGWAREILVRQDPHQAGIR